MIFFRLLPALFLSTVQRIIYPLYRLTSQAKEQQNVSID